MRAPFPYFGGKSKIAQTIWGLLGDVKSYTEPFAGSLAVLLARPAPGSLEVVGDWSGYIANFWRATKHRPAEVARWADYPTVHLDIGARHAWLTAPDRQAELAASLADPDWPGDAKIAGWWLWGQCAWIGSGWCQWGAGPAASKSKVPHMAAGRGINASGKVPHMGNAGTGINAIGKVPHMGDAGMMTHAGDAALAILTEISKRLSRVVVVHGDWERSVNLHYGTNQGGTAGVFLDPPYGRDSDAKLYGCDPVLGRVVEWCRENAAANVRIVLACHVGESDLPGWAEVKWSRCAASYGSTKTQHDEVLMCSPACLTAPGQLDMFGEGLR